jgi:hypothetical protein
LVHFPPFLFVFVALPLPRLVDWQALAVASALVVYHPPC